MNIIEWLNNIAGKLLKVREPLPAGYIPPPIELPIETPFPTPIPITPPIKTQAKEFNPQAEFIKPVLWKYKPDTDRKIFIAINYQDYITPENELVKYFSNMIYFEEIERKLNIKYKETEKYVVFKYRIDDSRLCKESNDISEQCKWLNDFWMNPEYYIWNDLEGDCGDYALTMSSVFEYLKIPYMFVSGYFNRTIPDFWVEFIYNDKAWLAQINQHNGAIALLIKDSRNTYKPYEMFNKRQRIEEYEKWY